MVADVAGLVAAITPSDDGAAGAARERLDRLAKPPGSLGRLEDLSVRLAAIAGACPPPVPRTPTLLVAAGDHGVHARGVTRWPQELSAAIAGLVADGRATAATLARQVGADVVVLDVGLASARPDGVQDARVRDGTRDLSARPAMTPDEAEQGIRVGVEAASTAVDDGADLLVLGEVGIANTTPSAALIAAFTGHAAAEVTGPGAANDTETIRRKIGVVEQSLARHGDTRDPLRTLASLGGLEHAALVGMILAAAVTRTPVVLDGVTTVAAALVATHLAPDSSDYLIAGHLSGEPGATVGLHKLGLKAILNLDLRLGEGTGALLAVPTVQSAARVLHDVALLDEF